MTNVTRVRELVKALRRSASLDKHNQGHWFNPDLSRLEEAGTLCGMGSGCAAGHAVLLYGKEYGYEVAPFAYDNGHNRRLSVQEVTDAHNSGGPPHYDPTEIDPEDINWSPVRLGSDAPKEWDDLAEMLLELSNDQGRKIWFTNNPTAIARLEYLTSHPDACRELLDIEFDNDGVRRSDA